MSPSKNPVDVDHPSLPIIKLLTLLAILPAKVLLSVNTPFT